MKLYDIANEYIELMQSIEDGEIPEEAIADTLEAVTGELEAKADNIACLIKNISAEIEAIQNEELKLRARRRIKEATKERLKDYLSYALQSLNIDKVETARNAISFRKSEAVELADGFIDWAAKNREELLSYGKPKANLTAIKELIKGGEEVTGAQLVIRQNIQIK